MELNYVCDSTILEFLYQKKLVTRVLEPQKLLVKHFTKTIQKQVSFSELDVLLNQVKYESLYQFIFKKQRKLRLMDRFLAISK